MKIKVSAHIVQLHLCVSLFVYKYLNFSLNFRFTNIWLAQKIFLLFFFEKGIFSFER